MPQGLPNVAIVMPGGAIAGAERVLLELLSVTEPGPVVVCAPLGSALDDAVTDLGHPVRDFSLPLVREVGPAQFAVAYARALGSLRAALQGERVDLVHAFLSTTLKVVTPVCLRARLPVVLSVHDITTTAAIGPARSLAQRLVARPVVSIVAVSHYVKRSLVAAGYPAARIDVVHNGIGSATAAVTARQDVRSALGLEEETLVFMVVGRMTEWKGHLVALQAFEEFARRGDDGAALVLVGGPFSDADMRYADEVRAAVEASPVRRLVHLLGQRRDVDELWQACDVALVPSTRPDPFPTTVLEAQRAGRPVVVTSLGGAREAIDEGVTGFVSEPVPAALAAAMARAADAGWRRSAGQAARRRIEEHFSAAPYAARIHSVWRAAAVPDEQRRSTSTHPDPGG